MFGRRRGTPSTLHHSQPVAPLASRKLQPAADYLAERLLTEFDAWRRAGCPMGDAFDTWHAAFRRRGLA